MAHNKGRTPSPADRPAGSTRRNMMAAGVLALIIVVAAVAVLAARGTSTTPTRSGSVEPTNFALHDQRDAAITSAQLRGHTTVLAFVEICSSGGKTLRTLTSATPPSVRALAVNYGASGADLARFAQGLGIHTGPNMVFASDPDGSAANALGLASLDTIVVLDARGHVTWSAKSPSQSEIARHLTNAGRL